MDVFNLEITISMGKKTTFWEKIHSLTLTMQSAALRTYRGRVTWEVGRNVEVEVLFQSQIIRICIFTRSPGDS